MYIFSSDLSSVRFHPSYAKKKLVIDSINDLYGNDENFLLNNVAYAEMETDNNLIFGGPFRRFHFEYYINNLPNNNFKKDNVTSDKCILILSALFKTGFSTANDFYINNFLKENKTFQVGSNLYYINNFQKKDGYYLVEYDKDTICINNLRSAFVFTDKEKKSNVILNDMRVDEVKSFEDINFKTFIFKINDEGSPYPIDIMISLKSQDNDLFINITSKRLRNKDSATNGYWEKTFIKFPEIILISKKDEFIISKKITNDSLGDVITTPLSLNLKNIKHSNYILKFKYTTKDNTVNELILSENLSL
jgi:hypothetical protein